MNLKSAILLSSILNAAFAVETTVHLSIGVASSVCSQHENYLDTKTVQPAVKSPPQSGTAESESECAWLTIPKSTPGILQQVFKQSCDQIGSLEQSDGESAGGATFRIVGGQVTEPHEFPSLVAIFFLNKPPTDDFRKYLCCGTVLSESWILTAAHCLDIQTEPGFYRIVAGSYNISDTTEPAQIRDVDKIIKHPKYQKCCVWEGYDIGLMHLKEPFVFDDKVQKLVLPQPGYQPIGGSQVTAVGRGRTSEGDTVKDFPRKANFTVVSEAGCQKAAGGSEEENISDTIICARVKAEDEKDVCNGDSGSMLLSYGEDGVPVQIGVISFGAGYPSGEKASCATKAGAPFGSTHIAKVLDWIGENTGES